MRDRFLLHTIQRIYYTIYSTSNGYKNPCMLFIATFICKMLRIPIFWKNVHNLL